MFDQMLVGTLAVQFWVVLAVAMLHFHHAREVTTPGEDAPVPGGGSAISVRSVSW